MEGSGYYPVGAEFDPRAPWNEKEIPEETFNVDSTFILHRECDVKTSDYWIEHEGYDMEGCWERQLDTFNTDWYQAYKDTFYTPLELFDILKKKCEKELIELEQKQVSIEEKRKHWNIIANLKRIIASCTEWEEEDHEIDKL